MALLRALVLTLATLAVAPALADPAALRAVLAVMPAPSQPNAAILARFIGLRDLRELPAFQGSEPRRFDTRLMPPIDSQTTEIFLLHDQSRKAAEWQAKTGIAMADISFFLDVGTAPSTVTIWGIGDETRKASFLSGLASRGFSASPDGVFSNGEPLSANPSKREPRHPFVGAAGQATVLAPVPGGVAQSPDPRAIAALRATGPRLEELPPVRAVLDGLEKAVPGALVPQAILFGPGIWVADPGMGPPEPSLKPLPSDAMVPPSPILVVADVEMRATARRGAVFALSYPDCGMAAKASAAFARAWRDAPDADGKTARARTGAEPITREIAGEKACAATIFLGVPVNAEPRNPVYRYVIAALLNREFPVIEGR